MLEEVDEGVEEAADVEQPDRLAVEAQLLPRDHLPPHKCGSVEV